LSVWAPPLEHLRLLGADGLAALEDPAASIEWWCQPDLDDDPVLWRLLDPTGAVARWCGAQPRRCPERTVGPSLRTIVTVDGAEVECLDALLRRGTRPTLVRLVRACSEPVRLTHELGGRPFQGPETTLDLVDLGGATTVRGRDRMTVVDAVPDEWRGVALGGDEPNLAVGELLAAVDDAEDAAARRAAPVSIITSHRDRVAVTLGVLDACADPVTGAVAASPTTSLPELPGGDRQFDYRFAWLRDASLAASVAALVGEVDVARRHLRWLRDRCADCDGIPTPLTTPGGEPAPEEREVAGVSGWAGSRPVRVGNAARDQLQLDGPGFVAEAVWLIVAAGGQRDRAAYRVVVDLIDAIERVAEGSPSAGIWELREPADVSSADVGRWMLMDRAVRLSWVHEPWAWRRRRRWRRAARRARQRFLDGRLPSGGAPLIYGQPHIDGAGLLPIVVGLLPRRDPAAAELVDATIAELGIGDPVAALRRYPTEVDDGFEGAIGAFVPVSWWAVSALARLGRVDEAHGLADRLCAALPGLQGEVIAPDGAMVGNTPLVWSHAEAARALYLLRVCDLRRRFGSVGVAAWRAWRLLRAQSRGRTSRSQKPKNPA
jgi:hypothetical protein